MPNESIFSDEWRDCLRAHYTYVVREDDRVTEHSLRGVLLEAGFSEREVKELYVLATAHVDHSGADFMPDPAVIAADEAFVAPAVVAPEPVEPEPLEESIAEETVDAEIPVEVVKDLVDEDVTTQPEAIEDADATQDSAEAEDEPPQDDPDITQLSLF